MEADQEPPTPDAAYQNADQPPTLHHQDEDDKLCQEIDGFISLSGDDQPDPPQILDSLHKFANLYDFKVVQYESGSKKWTQDESFSFIASIQRTATLLKSLSRFHSQQDYAPAINRISSIQQRAMSFMEDEFKSLLDDYQTSHDRDQRNKIDEAKPSSSPTDDQEASEPDLPENIDYFLGYSDEMVSNLKKLAKGLIGGGHETECSELYFFVRRNAIEQNLKHLRFEKFSIDEMQKMPWEPVEKEVSAWMKMFKDFSTSLLPSERRLVDAVFSAGGHPAIADSLFGILARVVLFYLLTFAEAVMMTKRSAEKLFKFLDIYETLRDSIPELEKLLSDDWLNQLRSAASLINTMLGDAIFNIWGDFENSIKADTTKTPVPGGAVHPLTRYTMNYLTYACEYRDTLEQVFIEHKKTDRAESGAGSDHDASSQEQAQNRGDEEAPGSPFQLQLARVMDLLDANLEAKSRLYKDPSLSLIFLMNNGRYILQKTKGTGEMRSLMGDPWVRKRSSDLRSYHTNYKRETWTKLLQCLSHEGLNVNGKVPKPVLKERFKSFNAMFDEIYRTQSTWVVSDEQLQSELRVSISAIVIPAYRSFMGRFSQVFTPGRQTEKYIKYQPEDIETCIEDLFDGNAVQQGKKR